MTADLGRRSFVTWFGVAAAGALRLAGEAVAGGFTSPACQK
jgi:hypothetical protein